jgi:hypothetical protein
MQRCENYTRLSVTFIFTISGKRIRDGVCDYAAMYMAACSAPLQCGGSQIVSLYHARFFHLNLLVVVKTVSFGPLSFVVCEKPERSAETDFMCSCGNIVRSVLNYLGNEKQSSGKD